MKASSGVDEQGAIAVVGMACRFPGADTPEAFWQNLCDGVISIRKLDDEELENNGVSARTRQLPNYVNAYSGPRQIDKFDASFFGITPGEAECMDPQHRLLLECAHEALERSGFAFGAYPGTAGVFAGTGSSSYLTRNVHSLIPDPLNLSDGRLSRDMQVMLGNEKSYVCTRISHKLDLKGPSVYTESACATSLVAIHLACKSLLDYECDTAVAGGARLEVPYGVGYLYQEGGMTSPEGRICTFDVDARGTVFASGVGTVVLKRLEDAIADGDTIHAVIRGSAVNNAGSDKVGFTAPSYDGQRNVILEAMSFAGISPDSLSYVEAHGTGTPMGDPIEIAALTAAFRTETARRQFCALGSLKPNVGHMDVAAGVAGVIKTVMALCHRKLPPSLNFNTPNPQIDFQSSPFFVNTQLRDWETDGTPRRAGVSSFGVGGTNAHVVIEEFIPDPQERPSRGTQLLVLSAKNERSLEAMEQGLAEHLQAHPEQNLGDIACTLQRGREAFSRRSIVVADDRGRAIATLRREGSSRPISGKTDGRRPNVAFLFPGQGSQHLDMALSLYRNEPVFRAALARCAAILQPHLQADLVAILYPSSDAREASARLVDQTSITQPALFSVSYALAEQWRAWSIEPTAMLGHSVGEYVAACLAGVFSLEDALRLIAARGRLMQGLPAGSMSAVALPEGDVLPLLDDLDLAAVNGPRNCVVSGSEAAIDRFEARMKARDVEPRRLRTSHAFHSSMMDPILDQFAEVVATVQLNPPDKRYVSNVTGDWIRAEDATSPAYWVRHLRSAVRFADGAQRLLAEPDLVLLEVGPGQTLSQLVRQQEGARGRDVVATLPHPREERDAQAGMLEALGRLWLANVKIDWATLYVDEQRQRLVLPTYPFERKRYWIEPSPNLHGAHASEADGPLPVSGWFHVPSWQQAPVASRGIASAERGWLLFADTGGLVQSIATALADRGEQVRIVRPGLAFADDGAGNYSVRPGHAGDYSELLASLAAGHGMPDRIVHGWCLDSFEGDYQASQEHGFYSVLFLAQALGKSTDGGAVDLTVLTRGAADVTGAEALEPMKASVLGPVRVVGHEQTEVSCRHLDVAGADVRLLTAQVLSELAMAGEAGGSVAYRASHRWKLGYPNIEPPQEIERAQLPFREGGVYVVTGGLGGLGLIFAEYLALHYKARLVLTGRKALPDASQWAQWLAEHEAGDPTSEKIRKIQAMEALGAAVFTAAVDVTDEGGMDAVMQQVRARFGPIHGVMHAAGVAGAGIIQLKDRGVAEQVIAPKIRGAQVLRKVLSGDPLEIVVLHASLFGVTGGAGQVDYCGANASLDLLAHDWSRQGVRVVSIDWDGWTEVGMAARAGLFATAPDASYHAVAHPHPMLDAKADDDEGAVAFMTLIHPDSHWIVNEHRIDGHPVMPGTSLLEMTIAAYREVTQAAVVELRDVLFLSPLAIDARHGSRVRLLLSAGEAERRFRIQKAQPDGTWTDHALGIVGTSKEPARMFDMAPLLQRSTRQLWDFQGRGREALPSGDWLVLRGRWESLQRIHGGHGEAVIEVALAPEHRDDTGSYRFHPALADLVIGVANGIWMEQKGNYLPFGYQQLTVWQPLPPAFSAHVRLSSESDGIDDSIVLDVLMVAPDGSVLAVVEGFTLKRMGVSTPAATQVTAAHSQALLAAEGIAPMEGVDALERVLAGLQAPQVVVSKRDMYRAARRQSGEDEREAHASWHERPELHSAYVPPSTDMERTLVQIWQELLGLKEVGIHDNFFDLGGDSLLATQIPSRLRTQVNCGIDLGTIFKSPTVAQIAEHIAARMWVQQGSTKADDADAAEREVGTL
jgi:acyl transferase domain-containing protein